MLTRMNQLMKTKILTVTVGLCFSFAVAQPARAQSVGRNSRSYGKTTTLKSLAPEASERSPTGQYSSVELEQTRTQLLDLTDTLQQFAAFAPPDYVDLDSLKSARGQIQQMSLRQLNGIRQGISPSKMSSQLTRARQQAAAYSQTIAEAKQSGLQPRFTDGTSFPVVSGLCDPIGNAIASAIGGTKPGGSTVGPDRIPVEVMLAGDILFFIADSVRELAQDACKQDVLGENASTACIIVDIVWIVAKAVDDGLHFCDDDLTGNVIDTNYARLDDIHSDLYSTTASLDTHLTSANTDIDTNIGNLNTHLTTANTDIDAKIAALDSHTAAQFTTLTTLIGNLSAQLTNATNQLVAGERQIMKLDLTPDGQRQLVPAILTCDGSSGNACPNVLNKCPAAGCSWNSVGPLP